MAIQGYGKGFYLVLKTIGIAKCQNFKNRTLQSDQNSLSHFLLLAANLPYLRLSLISLRKNTSPNQDLHFKS